MSKRDAVAQSIERATSRKEVICSIPVTGASAPYWLGRCQYNVAS